MENKFPYSVFQLAINGTEQDRETVYRKLTEDLSENNDLHHYLGKETGSEIKREEKDTIQEIQDILDKTEKFHEAADQILDQATENNNTELYHNILQYAVKKHTKN